MSEEECNNVKKPTTIDCLPSEVISMILKYNNRRDVVSFGATCKLFNDMVKSDQCLWKARFKEVVPPDSFNLMVKNGDGDWFTETKRFTTIKKLVYDQIVAMSPKFYWPCSDMVTLHILKTSHDDRLYHLLKKPHSFPWIEWYPQPNYPGGGRRPTEITLEDTRSIFEVALSHNISYYFVIHIIQDLVKRTKINLESLSSQKPFTLTEMFYSRVALRHLMHTYLALKWVRLHIKNELSPQLVINFFVQWVDTDHLYPDETVKEKINEIVAKVEKLMDGAYPGPVGNHDTVKERCDKGLIPYRNVLAATSYIIYGEMRMTLATSANIDTLNIVKVINNKCGHSIAVAAIYLAIVKSFGVDCELVAFPNHLFLEWRDLSGPNSPYVCTADLKTGLWNPRRRCPFSRNLNQSYKYYPDSLLQYIYTSFHTTMASIKNWHTQNALHLLDFLSTFDNDYNPYRNFLPYLLDTMHLPTMDIPLELKYLNESHMQLISELANLNMIQRTVNRSVIVKMHDSCVKFAVGMICCHKSYAYTCLIRGWDPSCAVEWQRKVDLDSLEYGYNQPFYYVIAADQSERYVAQENLVEAAGPNRLHHLEDFIGREFTHFDGYSYVPNDEKKAEYPNDMPVVRVYRQHWEILNNVWVT